VAGAASAACTAAFPEYVPAPGYYVAFCASFAALATVHIQAPLVQGNVFSAYAAYLHASASFESPSVVSDTEARKDFHVLRDLALGYPGTDGRAVPTSFFHRPLYAPESHWNREGWQSLLSEWKGILASLNLEDIYQRYMRISRGEGMDWVDAERRVEAWAMENVPGYTPAPKPTPPPSAPPKRADLRMLSDEPLEDEGRDLLDFKPYADGLAGLIDNPATRTPLVLAINAPWGAGKSTLGRMMQRRLEGKPAADGDSPHVTCWFNAWMHDDAPNLAGAFATEIARTADLNRPLWRKVLNPVPKNMLTGRQRHKRWLLISVCILVLAAVIVELVVFFFPSSLQMGKNLIGNYLSKSTKEEVGGPSTKVGWVVVVSTLLAALAKLISAVASASKSLGEFVKDPQSPAASDSMQQVREQLGKLMHQGTPKGSRFVVFVDDLDRCRPRRCMDVLEAVNQLLNHDNVVTVLLADMPALAACAQIKYKDLAEKYVPSTGVAISLSPTGQAAYGRSYLQKIIQLQFDLPAHPTGRIHSLVDTLAKEVPDPAVGKEAQPPAGGGVGRRLKGFLRLFTQSWQREETVLGQLRSVLSEMRVILKPLVLAVWPLIWPFLFVIQISSRLGYPLRHRLGLAPSKTWVRFGKLINLLAALYSILLSLVGVNLYGVSSAAKTLQKLPFLNLRTSALSEFAILLILGVLTWVRERLEFRHDLEEARKARQTIDSRIDQQLAAGERDFTRIQGVLSSASDLPWGVEELVRERLQLRIMNDSDLLREAYQEVVDRMPPLPRNAKRLINRLRLLIFIAQERGMFGGTPELTPQHIGKWAVLRERWPELAQALAGYPGGMTELEALAGAGPNAFGDQLKTLVPPLAGDQDLQGYCQSSTKLGPVMERLIHFEPAGPPEPPQARAQTAAN